MKSNLTKKKKIIIISAVRVVACILEQIAKKKYRKKRCLSSYFHPVAGLNNTINWAFYRTSWRPDTWRWVSDDRARLRLGKVSRVLCFSNNVRRANRRIPCTATVSNARRIGDSDTVYLQQTERKHGSQQIITKNNEHVLFLDRNIYEKCTQCVP